MGTDAGTDKSEKAPIGGRTSLTQLDTWLETMDGETLCLTGKVTDCWQPVDGTRENASFAIRRSHQKRLTQDARRRVEPIGNPFAEQEAEHEED